MLYEFLKKYAIEVYRSFYGVRRTLVRNIYCLVCSSYFNVQLFPRWYAALAALQLCICTHFSRGCLGRALNGIFVYHVSVHLLLCITPMKLRLLSFSHAHCNATRLVSHALTWTCCTVTSSFALFSDLVPSLDCELFLDADERLLSLTPQLVALSSSQ